MSILLRTCQLIALGSLTSIGSAQHTSFSIGRYSATVGHPDSGTATPISSGDILRPAPGIPTLGPLAKPVIRISHAPGGLGLALTPCGGSLCPPELDAFSYGLDDRFTPTGTEGGELQWSVSPLSSGIGSVAPNVVTENALSPGSFNEGSSDVYMNIGSLGLLPLLPAPSLGHRGLFDGDGRVSASGHTYKGLGLKEPMNPVFFLTPVGDYLDAFDALRDGTSPGPDAYFSLDSGIGPWTTGSAVVNGFVGGDVLKSSVGGSGPVLYAPAGLLGLDAAGVDTDDLDALILWDNGDGAFTPSAIPFDWLGGSNDMLIFSVRRGSAVIGLLDSISGLPIEEGDLLTTPLPAASGGLSPFPGLFIAAENLGLRTVRSGTATGQFGDDMDAADHRKQIFADCDFDGVDDTLAIAIGVVTDGNLNGIPDSCEVGPCTPLPNSTGFPTELTVIAAGSPGTGVHLEATSGPPGEFGYFLIGTGLMSPGLPISSGVLCFDTMGLVSRYNVAGPMSSGGAFDNSGVLINLVGTSTVGSGFDIPTTVPIPIGGTINAGSTFHFQVWHRDGFLVSVSNFSNAVTHVF